MKKLLILGLLLIFNVPSVFASADEDNKEDVKIETSTAEKERSLNQVACFLYRDKRILEVHYEGIGIPVVTISDYFGNIYSQKSGFVNYGIISLDLPIEEGAYQIEIQSSSYKGTGTFVVY